MTFNFTALRRHPIYPAFEQHAIEWLREHSVPVDDFLYTTPARVSLPLDRFFAETFRLDEPREVPYKLDELYDLYVSWCRDRGSAVTAARNGSFRQALHRHGFQRGATWTNKRIWLGPPLANGDSQPLSHLQIFFAETFLLDEPREVPYKLDVLYSLYTAWCHDHGVKHPAARNGAFRDALHTLGFRRAEIPFQRRVWLGPPLKQSPSEVTQ
jgi:hypothetical protein